MCFTGTSVFFVEFLTVVKFVFEWMILNFLPSMTILTVKSIRTSVFIIHEEFVSLPVGTLLEEVVVRLFRFPPKVLPVVTIFALTAIMFELVEGTKDSLEVEDVEVCIFL